MANRINTPFTNEHFAEFCRAMVGQPYWYGTVVYKCTESLRKRKAEQYPTHYGSGRTARYRDDIAKKKVCADCVGLIKGYAWTNGGQGVVESIGTDKTFSSKYGSNGCPDRTADGMFAYAKSKGCAWGTMDTLPEIPGIALRSDGHVGVYVGGGYAVDARGFNYGCMLSKVTSRKWTHWFELPFIEYGEEFESPGDETESNPSKDEQTKPKNETPSSTPSTPTVVIVSQGGKVNIRVGNGTQYTRLSSVAPGTTFEYIATAVNGWYAVPFGKRVGWVSGSYAQLI